MMFTNGIGCPLTEMGLDQLMVITVFFTKCGIAKAAGALNLTELPRRPV